MPANIEELMGNFYSRYNISNVSEKIERHRQHVRPTRQYNKNETTEERRLRRNAWQREYVKGCDPVALAAYQKEYREKHRERLTEKANAPWTCEGCGKTYKYRYRGPHLKRCKRKEE